MSKSDEIKNAVYGSDCYKFKEVSWDREPKFIVDIGANVGWFTRLAAEKKPNCAIFSYELMRENFDNAVLNLRDLENNNIKIRHMAVIGENKATAYALAPGNNIGAHAALYDNEDTYKSEKRYRELIFEKDAKGGTTIHHDLPDQISLKEIIDQNNIDYIDFLKLDCEGCEHEVLLHVLKHNLDKKILNMSLEFHGRTWPEWETIKKRLIDRFDSYSKNGSHILIFKNKLNHK